MAKRIPSLSPPVPRTGQTVSQFNNGCHWNWTTASDRLDVCRPRSRKGRLGEESRVWRAFLANRYASRVKETWARKSNEARIDTSLLASGRSSQ